MFKHLVSAALVIILSTGSLLAAIPKMERGNRYKAGSTVAISKSTKHVQGREYHNTMTGEKHRRVLIYDRSTGEFKGFSKLGRQKGDATNRHYFGAK